MNTNLTNSSLYIMDKWLNASVSTIVICNQILNLVLGLPLNSYIIFLLCTGGAGMDMFVTFVMNQSASEICLALAAPLSILCHVNLDLCYLKPLGFMWGISMAARTIFHCCVSIERYLAVVHPVTFMKYNRSRCRVSCSALIWTISLAFSILSIFTFPTLPFNLLGVIWGLVLTVDLFCCLSILKGLKRPGPGEMKKNRESTDASMNVVKQKAFTVVFINIMTFLLQIIPMSATFIFQRNFISLEAFNLSVAISLSINFSAGFVQPVFFLLKLGKLTFLRCS